MTVAVTSARRKRAGIRPPHASDLLAWYDRHRRDLPWRTLPGETPDPYRVWLSEIMLQQTGVKTVAPYFTRFVARWPDVRALAAAPLEDVLRFWAGLGYYARARNLHACARAVVEHYEARFPQSAAELARLPGIGPYTAAAIAAIAFDARAAAVDGNVERVVSRLFAVSEEVRTAKPRLRALTQRLVPLRRAGDFAQALMDLGATICTPKRPACVLCPLAYGCAARERGDPEFFPVKPRRKEGRLRRGAAFVALRTDRSVLLRSRPASGLLGGMSEVPTTEWTHDFDSAFASASAPVWKDIKIEWRQLPGAVRHVFTHFPLELLVYVAELPTGTAALAGTRWVALTELEREALSNLMRKVIAHALD